MKFPKLLIPFLAVVLPTIRFSANETEYKSNQKSSQNSGEEIASDDSEHHAFILRQFSDLERVLQFAKHTSHSSHRSHSSHSSHKSGSHSSHYSCSDCNGCAFDSDEEIEPPLKMISEMLVKK